ncbi:MAG: hypothetical protein H0Z29_03340 [Candidatus Marinimicrobia bacterium]|nr:hypothetical protein [Candidatus Neomarinimicrobiota bacterium]
MRIKSFYGQTLQEALNQAKEELGEDVIVLETKEIKGNGLLLENKNLVKLTVKIEEPESTEAKPKHEEKKKSKPEKSANEELIVKRQLDKLYNYFRNILNIGLPEFYENAWRKLCDTGIEYSDSIAIIEDIYYQSGETKVIDYSELKARVRKRIVEKIGEKLGDVDNLFNNDRTVFSFMGPTGCGKTTVLMEMALSPVLNKIKNKNIISTDIYRIGSMDRLDKFSQVSGIKLIKAKSPEELLRIVNEIDKGLVLIDTPIGDIDRYKDIFRGLLTVPDILHLVCIPANLDSGEIDRYMERFNSLKRVGIVLTKVDEVRNKGRIFSLIKSFKHKLFFFTMGNEIPESLHVINASVLAKEIIKEF